MIEGKELGRETHRGTEKPPSGLKQKRVWSLHGGD